MRGDAMREWKIAKYEMPTTPGMGILFIIVDASEINIYDFDVCFQIISDFEKAFKVKAALLDPRSMNLFADPQIKSRLAQTIVPGRLRWKPAIL